MSTNDGITKLLREIKKYVLHDMPTQVEWHTCKEVDWDAKTMTTVDVGSETELYDVKLGLGASYVRPKVGALCLIGKIENNDGLGYLIAASESDAVEFTADGVSVVIEEGKVKLNGEKHSIVKAEELKQELDKTKAVLEKVVETLLSWTVAPTDGGAALKALAITNLSVLKTGDYSNIKNDTIKHG